MKKKSLVGLPPELVSSYQLLPSEKEVERFTLVLLSLLDLSLGLLFDLVLGFRYLDCQTSALVMSRGSATSGADCLN